MAPGLPGPTREFAKLCRPDQRACPTTSTPDRLLVQRENHVDRGVDFDRLVIEQRRPIAPLPHRIERGLYQQWMPGDDFELLHRAILADNRMQPHRTCDARLPSQRRIRGLDSIDDHSSLHLAALLDARLRRLRRWRSSAHAADDAANHAAHRTARHAARNAALYAGIHVRRVFLDNLNVLRNSLRLHKFASVHQVYLWLDVHNRR